MRTIPFLLLALAVGCESEAEKAKKAAEFCEALATTNGGCWNEDLDQTCLDRYAECGENILTMESCPVQLACG